MTKLFSDRRVHDCYIQLNMSFISTILLLLFSSFSSSAPSLLESSGSQWRWTDGRSEPSLVSRVKALYAQTGERHKLTLCVILLCREHERNEPRF
jgi:hypothetical protein